VGGKGRVTGSGVEVSELGQVGGEGGGVGVGRECSDRGTGTSKLIELLSRLAWGNNSVTRRGPGLYVTVRWKGILKQPKNL